MTTTTLRAIEQARSGLYLDNIRREVPSILPVFLLLITMLFIIYGCESSSTDSASASDDAELVIGLTDAEGDFLSYTVDVLSLKMINTNGQQVETLPLTTQLDFAQYVDVTEFLTAAAVPSGHYRSAQIVLDYSNADIKVQDESGNVIDASVQDSNGDPLTEVTVDVTFNGDSDFVIAPGVAAHLTLDFDLDASNTITINGASATVEVSPVLIADTILEQPKQHRLRGLLADVDTVQDQFKVLIRPFRHRLLHGFGQMNVQVSDETSYEIDGQVVSNESGLDQLSQLAPASAIIVLGDLDTATRQFTAQQIYAGSSVPWGDKDVVTGTVIARSGNDITVRGATIVLADGSFIFNDNVSIKLGDLTTVVKQASAGSSYTIHDVSIGQRITVLGTITDDSAITMQADHVRLMFTNLRGSVVSASPLVLDVLSIDNRRVAMFDFSGTGSDSTTDALASHYEVDTASLSLQDIQLSEVIRVRGHVRSFAMAPEDFDAQTIIDAKVVRTQLVAGFGSGEENAISSLDGSGLLLDMALTSKLHHIYRGGKVSDLTEMTSAPLIAPDQSGRGLYMIVRGNDVRMYHQYDSYLTALRDSMDGNVKIMSVNANGIYDVGSNTLQAEKLTIRLSK